MRIYNTENSIVGQLPINKLNHQLLERPILAKVRQLAKADIPAMASLSEVIYDSLAEGQECFIHKKDEAYFENTIDNDNINYFGVFDRGNLVAMSVLNVVEDNTGLWEEFPTARLDFFSEQRAQRLGVEKVRVACLGADSVHPDYRGNNINSSMVAFRTEYAKKHEISDCVSIIDRKNVWNMKPYFNNDYTMFDSTIDPADNGKIALFHLPLKENRQNDNINEEIVYTDFSSIDNHFKNDKVCTGVSRSGHLQMANTSYYKDFNNNNVDNNTRFLILMERRVAFR